mmetsp:Transcript_51091/g.123328  ORF Transcript_51091/g.123328 Transcript_51091/m.123328 type:complete len:84 (-) Transcript_51091:85-336(-)
MFAAGSASSPPPPSSSSSSSSTTTSQQQRSSSASTDTSNNNNKPGISGEPPIFQRSRSYKFASTPTTEDNDSSNQQMRPDPFL